jgi:transcriptional regulator with XRE-family HTH domain
MLEVILANNEEVCLELGARLKAQRLAQLLSREELAARAGISAGTVRNLEVKGHATLESLVRITRTLGLYDHLQTLFVLQRKSIAQMEQAEQAQRLRAPARKNR